MEKADWKGFKARRRESQKRGKLRGIGMATYTERCGGGFPETASIEFKGDRVDLVMGNQEYGTGLVTSYKQLVSDRLGIDADRIDVVYGDSRPLAARPHRRLARAARRRLGAARGLAEDHRQGQADRREPAGGLRRRHRVRRRRSSASSAPTGMSICSRSRRPRSDPAKLPPGMEPGLDTTQVQNPAARDLPERLPHRRGRDRSRQRRHDDPALHGRRRLRRR